ncbi:hypothetical protein TSOC_012577 [Tetrabaena socialis]|uniref:Pherophorin domain-containing protein n=1 Tax=Tetrabaena socialis TaxID=47790 RepID=A0A2J7ZMN7_9CHLO|nr:hypothetical protein TSOC_012577 [Tetrabaena socialis]|eukprot:PNH01526.1 hypothetical protein TSOC_012577 [Tetrabaena socialis]
MMRRSTRLAAGLCLAALALFAESASAARSSSSDSMSFRGRQLLQSAAPLNRFPYCKCNTYDCGCSPYKLTLAGATPAAGGATRMCFAVGFIGCSVARPCCQAFLDHVDKLAISTILGYELRVYDLTFNQTTFPGLQICITAKAPCMGLQDLCDSASSTCTFSLAESSDTKYCPICAIPSISPPPPSPPPPSPPPPPPPSPPPPSPPPPSPPPPCEVCAYVNIYPPSDLAGRPLFTFNAPLCASTGALMVGKRYMGS